MAADVLVLGAGGMFGHVADAVLRQKFKVLATARQEQAGSVRFDVLQPDADLVALARDLRPGGVILNAVAIAASQMALADAHGRKLAVSVNAIFPQRLARVAFERGLRVIHISTDAVFPADCGIVTEADPIAPPDAYAASKAQGELDGPHCITIRCSIIGPSRRPHGRGLWAWVKDQPPGATISGYANQLWSGMTTRQLAMTCLALVEGECFARVRVAGAIHHLAPNPVLSKLALVRLLAQMLRPDVSVEPADAVQPVNRQLRSRHKLLDEITPQWPTWLETLNAAINPQRTKA